jgi:hypothetical protein
MTFFLLLIVVVLVSPVVAQCPVASSYMNDVERSSFAASLVSRYPTLVSRFSIGTSQQNRSIEGIKISDSNDVSGELEPAIKFVANIHGNEVVGNYLVAAFACHLLTEYTRNNQTIRNLVDSTEIFLVLSFNPDGFALNSRTTASFVDLNRAFPDDIIDRVDTCDGRPVETCAMMNWLRANQFLLSAHFHGGALVVNYPRDGRPDGAESPPQAIVSEDDALFRSLARTYADRNPAILSSSEFVGTRGITNGAAWYPIYGGVQDYCYLWHDHFDFTIEVSMVKNPNGQALPSFWEQNRDSMIAFSQRAHIGIKGIVLDSVTGTPIVGATIKVVGAGRDVRTRTSRGSFFRLLLPGTYTVQISAIGYLSTTVNNVVVPTIGSVTMSSIRLVRNGTTTTTRSTTTSTSTTSTGGGRVAITSTTTETTTSSSSLSSSSTSSTSSTSSLYIGTNSEAAVSLTDPSGASIDNHSGTTARARVNEETIVVDSVSVTSDSSSNSNFLLTAVMLVVMLVSVQE